MNADVVVVGGGIAGMVAAVRLAELGQRVLVLEKGEGLYRCNSRFTGGAFHVCFHDIAEGGKTLALAIIEGTNGFADPGLAAAIGNEARETVDWMRRQGIRYIKAGPDAWRQNFLAPPGLMKTGLHWQGRGGDVMLRTLRRRLEALGGKLLCGARARELVNEGGRVAGVRVDQAGGSQRISSHSVVLCDGGFQANMDLMRRHVSPAPEKLKQRGAATGVGDALLMAIEVGAALRGMENIYGHILCRQSMEDDRLWPYPILDFVCSAGIVINSAGKRFMDEGQGGVAMTNCIARLADPLSATVVFDRAIWQGPATDFILPSNPHLPLAGGQVIAAQTLEELARRLGVSSDDLTRTVTEYNSAVDAGAAGSLSPPRSTHKVRPWPLRVAPFYAVPLAAGVTYTMGGIATDDEGRVLREDNSTIEGLFASGSATGGLEGGVHAGYVGGLIKSAVMSRRLAEAIARKATIH